MKPDFKKMELIPAIVQDYKTKQVLMLAYVNEESYEYMLKNKQTCFYSRSRKELWHKGETSGNYQEIQDMYLDCDQDAILILVKQKGKGVCHTGEYSCFFNNVWTDVAINNEAVNAVILDEVYSHIVDGSINPKENSYTNYLLDEGIDKICKKVGEEATETVIAAKNPSKDDLVGEISDLTYHTLVLMFKCGVTIEDVKRKMIDRHRKQGNKKKKNIKGEY